MKEQKLKAARELVEFHVSVEDEIIAAFVYEVHGGDHESEPIKLLEVNRATVPAGIMPIYFGSTKGTPYSVVIVELTEEEFRALEQGALNLPKGWDRRVALHRQAA